MPLLLGVVVLILLLMAVGGFSKADPKQTARVVRLMGGAGALIFAIFLALRGEIGLAIPLGAAGLSWLGWISLWPAGFAARRQKAASRVRSAFLEMELDHDSGAMRGRVVAGRHEGAALDTLDVSTLIALLGEIDADSRQLLMTYLDRREPRWREHAQGYSAAGGGGTASSGKMTEEEAYQILGVRRILRLESMRPRRFCFNAITEVLNQSSMATAQPPTLPHAPLTGD
jgi:hypothetical protein